MITFYHFDIFVTFFYTGKEAQNATLSHGVIMCQAIKKYLDKTGYQVLIVYYIFIVCIQFIYLKTLNLFFIGGYQTSWRNKISRTSAQLAGVSKQ